MSIFGLSIGDKVTPLTPQGDVKWGTPTKKGQIDWEVDSGPQAGEVYVVSGYDFRWSIGAIFLAEFPPRYEDEPGFAVSAFRRVDDAEIEAVRKMMKKLGAKS